VFIKALGVPFGYSVTVQPLPHLRSPHTERTGKLLWNCSVGSFGGRGITWRSTAKSGV